MKRLFPLLLALVLILSLALPAAASFRDVPENAWYTRYVDLAETFGLMRGRSEERFAPEADIKLSEAIKLASVIRRLWMGGDPMIEGTPWYQVYVDFALDHGIVEHVPENLQAPATRRELAHLLAAALPEEEYPAINRIDDGAIPDVLEDPAVYLLYRAGVLTGGTDGAFRPGDTIRRSEVAAMVVRVVSGYERIHFSLVTPGRTVTVREDDLAGQVYTLVNEARAEAGLPPLAHGAALDLAADRRAAELEQRYGHTRPDGSSCFSIYEELQIPYRQDLDRGENINVGFLTAEEVFAHWMASEGNKQNIMGTYNRLAVSCHVGADGVVYWVQLFANE